jgi:predicted RND superfamily exporter protein
LSHDANSAKQGDHPIVRARWVILAAFVLVCGWLIPGVFTVENDDDVLAFLPPDHEEVQNFHRVAETFGMTEVALVGIEDNGRDLLSAEKVDEVRSLSTKVKEIAGVNVVLSFADLPNPVVTEDGVEVAPLVPEDVRDDAEIRRRVLGSHDAVGNLISEDGKAAALLVFLVPREGEGAEAFAKRRATLEDIRATVETQWSGDAQYTGAPFIEMAASESSRSDIEKLSPIVIGVLAVASALLLASVSAAFINLLVTGLGVALIMGAHGRFGEPMTIVSSSTPVMMVALGGAFGVHMLAGYQRQSGTSRERASATLRELWLPVLLSGGTTSVAFFALVVMPQVPMQRFGVVAGIGVLLLLVLALLVIPALLAILPEGLIKTRTDRRLPLPKRPPTWVLALISVAGIGFAARSLEADPDTANVFAEDSAPSQANRFFNENFQGSTFLQVTIEGPLGEAAVLRTIRDLSAEISRLDGVVDVRSVADPVVVLNEALGGRRGIPETAGRARRVMTYLIGHPAMKQLITDDADGALIHIKLRPMDGKSQVALTQEVRELLERRGLGDEVLVAPTSVPAVAEQRDADVARHLGGLLGREIDPARADGGAAGLSNEARAEIIKLRNEVFDPVEGAVEAEVPPEELNALTPESLLAPRGEALEKLMREKMPKVLEQDAEGIKFAAEHLGAWIDEAMVKYEAGNACPALGIEDAKQCETVGPVIAEFKDEEWAVPAGTVIPEGVEARVVPLRLGLTGQPVIGQAFGESVTRSLMMSTFASVVALGLMLLISRQIRALVPAVWTLTFTAGIIALLGHPISVGTSMVACIALGAGVDFAIHLGFRARSIKGPTPGEDAVNELGAVVVISAVQLALAFLVLAASEMPPLQHFGIGLAIGLIGAALGAVWLTPILIRGPRNPR